ncbi:hypothetical protein GCM10027427_35220 [Pseudoclavibacter terrae]
MSTDPKLFDEWLLPQKITVSVLTVNDASAYLARCPFDHGLFSGHLHTPIFGKAAPATRAS